jgi:hypothetical protein
VEEDGPVGDVEAVEELGPGLGFGGGDDDARHIDHARQVEAGQVVAVGEAVERGVEEGAEPPGEATQEHGALLSEALPRRCPARPRRSARGPYMAVLATMSMRPIWNS